MAKRISLKNVGQEFSLRFTGDGFVEKHILVKFDNMMSKKLEDARATFRSPNGDSKAYEWEAYRYNGHWAYGTSADRLTVTE